MPGVIEGRCPQKSTLCIAAAFLEGPPVDQQSLFKVVQCTVRMAGDYPQRRRLATVPTSQDCRVVTTQSSDSNPRGSHAL